MTKVESTPEGGKQVRLELGTSEIGPFPAENYWYSEVQS